MCPRVFHLQNKKNTIWDKQNTNTKAGLYFQKLTKVLQPMTPLQNKDGELHWTKQNT